ncbi:DEAD/DEAH box helicase [Haloactinomyces albus]|uniref:SNF2 family DNA or RNA helicase n=1 Tax=Haloactinomyces albus TaxID=1352928 RepID=A0AAE3ZIH8_9ACTN|nr:DEAD/DEAH box helicase [Haloactinomyces albus]MDR7304219.1 SNF2 family DNA or RNA helicase [Haloactinomyces albus]
MNEPPRPEVAPSGVGEHTATAADTSRIGDSARQVLADAWSFLDTASHLLSEPARLWQQVQEQYEQLSEQVMAEQLREMPLDKLREAASGKLRLGDLENAGLRNVHEVFSATPEQLQRHPGIGLKTASQVSEAAEKLATAARRQAVFRFDPDRKTAGQAELLGTLRAVEVAEQATAPLGEHIHTLTTQVDDLARRARRTRSKMRMFFSRRETKTDALQSLAAVETLLGDPRVDKVHSGDEQVRHATEPQNHSALWHDYQQRAATYNTLLARLTGAGAATDSSAQGAIPREVEREVSSTALDTSLLRSSLRGYQAFGAKFALARRHSLLGDEMGLGKTIEALAAMAHLAVTGQRHFLVVCPAGVLVNWIGETGKHSDLTSHSLHGPHRDSATQRWKQEGGVAVTTYETLRRLPELHGVELGMVVIDEAHYVKNPDAKRSRAVAEMVRNAERALFLTGTPMENRLAEFKTLVGYLQPEVAEKIRAEDVLMGADSFRRIVAPVYLRRNQEDVLTELPEKLELDDWVELGGADGRAYRDAVAGGNFMAARRAAYEPGTAKGSAKLERLVDIVTESAENGWKVVVFSYFLEVLETVRAAVGPAATQPLTGKLTPQAKQELVDDFTRREGHAVLPGQITAGGVGLNIQAASVVILAEPQLKPSTEEQAIARCHRMGQTRKVHVHRLMAKDTVDQRLQEVLEGKARLFDAYARHSAAKASEAAATDTDHLNEQLLHDEAVPMEQRILQVERERLGIG